MNDALNKFKAEMEKRGLFRKITVAANLIPPPPGLNPEALIAIHKLAAKEALIMYAQKHDDFSDLLAEAAFDTPTNMSRTANSSMLIIRPVTVRLPIIIPP